MFQSSWPPRRIDYTCMFVQWTNSKVNTRCLACCTYKTYVHVRPRDSSHHLLTHILGMLLATVAYEPCLFQHPNSLAHNTTRHENPFAFYNIETKSLHKKQRPIMHRRANGYINHIPFIYLTPALSKTFSLSITLSPKRNKNIVLPGHISVG